jgi:hypothetical protein
MTELHNYKKLYSARIWGHYARIRFIDIELIQFLTILGALLLARPVGLLSEVLGQDQNLMES